MPHHMEVPDVYFLLVAMVLGQPVRNLPENAKFDLNSVWTYVFGTSSSSTTDIADKVNLS